MKNNLYKTYFVSACMAMALLISCGQDKESPGLPPITSEGKNTFGCKINGEIYAPVKSQIDAGMKASFDTLGNQMLFDSADFFSFSSSNGLRLSLYLRAPIARAKFWLDKWTYEYPIFVRPPSYLVLDYKGKTYITSSSDTGNVIIEKFDIPSNVISGTFEAFFYDPILKKGIKVTEGRFDYNWRTSGQ